MPFLPCARRRLPDKTPKPRSKAARQQLQKEMSRLNEAIARNDKTKNPYGTTAKPAQPDPRAVRK